MLVNIMMGTVITLLLGFLLLIVIATLPKKKDAAKEAELVRLREESLRKRLECCHDGKPHEFRVVFDYYHGSGGYHQEYKDIYCNRPLCKLKERILL